MLPTFAPTVISVATSTADASIPAIVSTEIANGMKVTSATSLVMSIEEKYVSDTSTSTTPRWVRTMRSRREPTMRNTPMRWNPHTTSIRHTSWAIVLVCT